MHSQLIITSTKLELADHERSAMRSRHAREYRATGEGRRARLFASLRRRGGSGAQAQREVSLRAFQKPSV